MIEQNKRHDAVNEEVALRRFPYPYRAMLAISSDLDETPDRHVYAESMRFLNTTEMTAMGPGVGLEVSNSIYFDMPPGQFCYWSTDDAGKAMVQDLIRSGHIDCLHSFGDLVTTRAAAGKALDELAAHDCRTSVWVDHATAPTNLGAGIMAGHGDEPGHAAYHADLTIGHGIRYIWRGRVTSVLGQNAPPSLGGLWTPRHPLASARTIGKEAAKRMLARRGDPKYAIHGPNRTLRKVTLRDGVSTLEFLRSNPHWGGVSSCETARGIGQVLTDRMLDRLVGREGVCILYTHLGKIADPATPFGPSAVQAFGRLAGRYRSGAVLTTTVSRALGYLAAVEQITWSTQRQDGLLHIEVTYADGAAASGPDDGIGDLAGLTFLVPEDTPCRISVNGVRSERLIANPPDQTGHASVSLPRARLEFPDQ